MKNFMKNSKFFFITFCIFFFSDQAQSNENELLKLIQIQYKNISSFSGQFVQISFKKNSVTPAKKANGEIIYKRPGKMLWSYKVPEEHLLVTNGKFVWLFDPLLENVTIQNLKKIAGGTALSFLLGVGDLNKDFLIRDISFFLLKSQDGLIVEMVPKKYNSNLAFIQLQVNPDTYNLKKILLMGLNGDFRTIELKSIKYNIYLDDKLFEFKITEDMEVIKSSQ